MLTASYLYSGYSDYFNGYGGEGHLLYAFYGRDTSLRNIINQLVEDSWSGEGLPEEVTESNVRVALLDMLSSQGRADYASGAIAKCSVDWTIENDLAACPECDARIEDIRSEECPECGYMFNDDDYDDYCEYPVFIVVMNYEKPLGS